MCFNLFDNRPPGFPVTFCPAGTGSKKEECRLRHSPILSTFSVYSPLPKHLLRIIPEMKLYSAAIGGIVFLQIDRLFHFILGLLPEAMLLQPGDQPLAEYPGNTKCCQHCSDDLNCHECISSAFNDCFPQLMFSISDSGLVFNHFRNGRFGFSA